MNQALAIVVLGLMTWLGGCETSTPAPLPGEGATVATGRPLPSYAEAVAKYNARVAPLDRLIARATIRLTYTDEAEDRQTEQPDGTLQIVRPRRLAIDLGKAGKKLFWFGSDEERYWWLDLNAEDRYAAVGRHDRFDAHGGAAGRRLGIAIRPIDLIAATGISPLDPRAAGATQWSKDGSQLGIVAPLGDRAAAGGAGARAGARGFVRVWVDPATMMSSSIEVFDASRRLVLRARHEGEERVEITRTGVPGSVGDRPRIPARITVEHFESQSELRISLSDAKDAPISDKAFMLEELIRRLGVERTIDLDAPTDE